MIGLVDPTFELFWKDIAEAYRQVAADHERDITIQHEHYLAIVWYDVSSDAVLIEVKDNVEVKPPTLVVP